MNLFARFLRVQFIAAVSQMSLPSRAVSAVFETVQGVAGKLNGMKDVISLAETEAAAEAAAEGENDIVLNRARRNATPVLDDETALQKLTNTVMASLESQQCLQRAMCHLGTYANTFTNSNRLLT